MLCWCLKGNVSMMLEWVRKKVFEIIFHIIYIIVRKELLYEKSL